MHYDMLQPVDARTRSDRAAPTPSWTRVALADKRDVRGDGALAWRPAQARGRADDRARAEGLHVRRADRRHERRRGAGGARPHRAAQAGHDQDHPAGRAQDGRGALARRPHHRAAQRQAGRRRQARRGDRLAGGAGGLSRLVRPERRRPHERPADSLAASHTHIGRYHILHGVDLAVPRKARPRCCSAATAPARPRRCAPSWACGSASLRRRSRSAASASRRRARPTSRAPASAMCRRPWRCSPTSR